MKIIFTGINGQPGQDNNLSGIARKLGLTPCYRVGDKPDLLICVDYSTKYKHLIIAAKGLGLKSVLIKQEPAVVCPPHRFDNPHGLFDLVVPRASSAHTPVFPAHQVWDTSHLSNDRRLKRVVAVSSDKWSFVSGELYSLRSQLYSEFPIIDVFGKDWGESRLSKAVMLTKELTIALRAGLIPRLTNLAHAHRRPINYLGPAADKLEVMSNYHAALVIENDETSMSEKLLDCILAGTIPIYVGPEPGDFGIPNNFVIRSKPDMKMLGAAISKSLELSSRQYRSNVLSWVSLPGTRSQFEGEEVGARVLRHIINKTT